MHSYVLKPGSLADAAPRALQVGQVGAREPKAQSNFTDPESRIMNTSTEGFQQCYNAQTAVDEAHQIIVATQVGAQASDQGRLMPLLDEVSDSFGVEPEVVLADAGYCNEADLVALEERGIDGYVALGREGKARVAVDPHTRAATHRMGKKLACAKGKAQYAKRKWMSEGSSMARFGTAAQPGRRFGNSRARNGPRLSWKPSKPLAVRIASPMSPPSLDWRVTRPHGRITDRFGRRSGATLLPFSHFVK